MEGYLVTLRDVGRGRDSGESIVKGWARYTGGYVGEGDERGVHEEEEYRHMSPP